MRTMKAREEEGGPRAPACAGGICGVLLGFALLLFFVAYGYPHREGSGSAAEAQGRGGLGVAVAAAEGASAKTRSQGAAAQSLQAHPIDLALGKKVFSEKCVACHGVGKRGAPMLKDVNDWHRRTLQGIEVLVEHAVDGHKRMPPKGGFAELSDEDVAAAVTYIVHESREILARADHEPATDSCDMHGRVDGCSAEQMRKVLVLRMLQLLAGHH
jgi:cytochrome c5